MRLYFFTGFLLLAALAAFFMREPEALPFSLVDPEEAPAEIKEAVMLGYRQMLYTKELLPDYVGAKLSCANCHFDGGNTAGGEGSGISLAGAAANYPRYNPRSRQLETLEARINDCFTNSMNGKPLPLDSKEMLAFTAYLHWISSGIPIYSFVPWLGLPRLRTTHTPDPEKGKALYISLCADCHGKDGAGKESLPHSIEPTIPPLWGEFSFNTSAGLNNPELFSAFIFRNMPYQSPGLKEEEAADIAAYVLQQNRPKKR